MVNIKVTISLNPNILEALDAVAKKQLENRSVCISRILKNDPDVFEVLEGILEGSLK